MFTLLNAASVGYSVSKTLSSGSGSGSGITKEQARANAARRDHEAEEENLEKTKKARCETNAKYGREETASAFIVLLPKKRRGWSNEENGQTHVIYDFGADPERDMTGRPCATKDDYSGVFEIDAAAPQCNGYPHYTNGVAHMYVADIDAMYTDIGGVKVPNWTIAMQFLRDTPGGLVFPAHGPVPRAGRRTFSSTSATAQSHPTLPVATDSLRLLEDSEWVRGGPWYYDNIEWADDDLSYWMSWCPPTSYSDKSRRCRCSALPGRGRVR